MQAPPRRSGVTLIELLVVIAIMTTLATMIVAVAPRFGERQRASRGASMLQSWLNLAKQRALRDRRPVGIRLPYQNDPSLAPGVGYVRYVEYVEVPDESIGGSVTVPYPGLSYQFVQLTTTVNFATGMPNSLLLAGDVILIPGPAYAPRRLTPTNPPPAADDSVTLMSSNTTTSPPQYTYKIRLDQALTATPSTTSAYRVSRQARPIVGETVLQLPKDIAIDISNDPNTPTGATPSWYRMYPPTANNHGTSPFNILFSPAGQVIGAEGNLGSRICLWVRDVSLGDPGPTQMPPGYNTLITVYTRTGQVTAHEVYPGGLSLGTNWNPFLFTQDGLTSGY